MFSWLQCLLVVSMASFVCAVSASGQSLSIEGGPVSNAIQRVSMESSPRMLEARESPVGKLQTRVTVQYLMVDDATRAAIYKGIDRSSLVSTVRAPAMAPRNGLDESTSPVASLQQIQSPSRVTTCVLDETQFADLISSAVASPVTKINVAPKLILLDRNEVEMTDLVQRPFVIGFDVEDDVIKPRVHVLDEGTRLRLVANLTDPEGAIDQPLDLKCELTVSRVLDVGTDHVYGVKDEPLAVQVPVQRTTIAVVSQQISAGQTLLVDPHVRTSRRVTNEVGIPMLGKIPYVGRTFKNVSATLVDQHMLLLLQPKVEPIAR